MRAKFISVGWEEVAFEPTLYILGERGYTSKDKAVPDCLILKHKLIYCVIVISTRKLLRAF